MTEKFFHKIIRKDDHDYHVLVELKIPIGVLLIRVVDLSLDIIDIWGHFEHLGPWSILIIKYSEMSEISTMCPMSKLSRFIE